MSALIQTRVPAEPSQQSLLDERRSLLRGFDASRHNNVRVSPAVPGASFSTLDAMAAKTSTTCNRFCGKRRNVLFLGALLTAVLIASVLIPITVWMTTHYPVTLGPGDYVFATFHDLRDVLVFNVTEQRCVWPSTDDKTTSLLGGGSQVSELRQLMVLGDGSLLLVQSLTMNSIILRLPRACSGHNMSAWIRSSLLHPYSLAADNGRGILYVTNQDSNLVTRYNSSTGEPLPPNAYFATVQNPRGIAVDPRNGNVYVSVRDEDQLVEYGQDDGNRRLRSWKIGRPIQVIFNDGLLFVGGSTDDEVIVIDLDKGASTQVLTDPLLKHPSGIAVVRDILLVMSQDLNLILAWSQTNRTVFSPLGIWKQGLPMGFSSRMKRDDTAAYQFVSPSHREAMAVLCKPHNEYGLSDVSELATQMWSLVRKDTQKSLLGAVSHVLKGGTQKSVLTSTWMALQALRALRVFLDETSVQLQLQAKSCVSLFSGDAKKARRGVKLLLLQVEACRITAAACADVIAGDVASQSVSALVEFSSLWSDSLLADAVEDAMYAMCSLAWDDKSMCSVMREHFRHRLDERRGALLTEVSAWGSDVFLLPGHKTSLFLWKLAKIGLVPCGTYRGASVAIDTRSLDDYRAVRAGVGVTVVHASWTGDEWRPQEVCFERFELLGSGGTKRQRVFVAGTTQEMMSFLLDNDDDDDDDERKILSSHLRLGCRVPVASSTFVRQRFVSGAVVVSVDSHITFGPLSGDWTQFVDHFIGDVTSRADCVRYPHTVVSVTLNKDGVCPPTLKKLLYERGLCFAPSFSIDLASIACCFGDENFPFSPYLKRQSVVDQRMAEIKSQEQIYKRVAKKKLDSGDLDVSMEEIGANQIRFMGRMAREDPKTFLTSERTALTWVQTAIVFGTNSMALLALNTLPTRIGGLILIVCAIICALYALFRWHWRRSSLEQSSSLAAFQDQLGPFIVALIMVFMMVSQLVISNLTGYL